MSPQEVVVRSAGEGFRQDVEAGAHRIVVDEPVAFGGTDAGPSPYALLLAALGACTAMTLRLYARHKGWPLETVEVRLSHDKIHAKDCATCETKEGRLDRIEREVIVGGPLTDEQRERLGEIADRCPVHRTLTSEIHIHTRVTTPSV
jgi:putative redox protein